MGECDVLGVCHAVVVAVNMAMGKVKRLSSVSRDEQRKVGRPVIEKYNHHVQPV